MDKLTGPRIIALTGPKTCGKDTIAKALLRQNLQVHNRYVPLFKKTPFAEGVKTICNLTFGWSFKDMDDPIFKETPLLEWPNCEPRWPMMDIANFMRDKYGPDVWVHTLKRRIETLEKTDRHGAYIITDLRFPNEIDWLLSMNAMIVYIYRPEAEEALAKAQEAGDPKALNPSEAHYAEMEAKATHHLTNDQAIYHAEQALMNLVRHQYDHWTYWNMGSRSRPLDSREEHFDVVA